MHLDLTRFGLKVLYSKQNMVVVWLLFFFFWHSFKLREGWAVPVKEALAVVS